MDKRKKKKGGLEVNMNCSSSKLLDVVLQDKDLIISLRSIIS